jgi:hypothetical protein
VQQNQTGRKTALFRPVWFLRKISYLYAVRVRLGEGEGHSAIQGHFYSIEYRFVPFGGVLKFKGDCPRDKMFAPTLRPHTNTTHHHTPHTIHHKQHKPHTTHHTHFITAEQKVNVMYPQLHTVASCHLVVIRVVCEVVQFGGRCFF